MPQIAQNKPAVVNTTKRVKEEIVRFRSPLTTLEPGDDVELQLMEGAGADYFTVRIGEGVELLSLGIESKYTAPGQGQTTGGWVDDLSVKDYNDAVWNAFYVAPEQKTTVNSNTLPFNAHFNFERKAMAWGFKSFLSSNDGVDIAPTLKLPEGDRLRLFARASALGDTDISMTADEIPLPTSAIIRRYLAGSDIDYKHFDQYDGGMKSQKRYYEDYQYLAETTPGQYTDAWSLMVIRNEAYKFFQAGVIGVDTAHDNIFEAKIVIDDPLVEYNKYYVNPDFNHLPFVDTYSIYEPFAVPPIVDTFQPIEKAHRFAPTIDILKNRNKDLKLKVKDDANAKAEDIVTRFYGVRYIL